VNVYRRTMSWFRKRWLKLKSLYALWTISRSSTLLKSKAVSEKTYYTRSGLDYKLTLDDNPLIYALSFSYSVALSSRKEGFYHSTINLTIANMTGAKSLEPDMVFDSLKVQMYGEDGITSTVKFKDVCVIEATCPVSVEDLMTEHHYVLTGLYLPVE